MTQRLFRARPASQQSGPYEIPGMLIASRDRVEKLKSTGKSALEAVAEKPFADLDSVWGKGIINSDQWVQIAYLTL